jgi:hypothetical protein
VADARERGAGPVVIRADPGDTPKHFYNSLGFRPLHMGGEYIKMLEAQPKQPGS